MTAAGGVVHEEFHSAEFTRRGGMFEVAQLWVNLPAREKMSRPRYQAIVAEDIPQIELPNGAGIGRVIAGELAGVKGAATTFTPLIVADLRLAGGHIVELPLPDGFTTLLVVQHGSVSCGGRPPAAGVALAMFERAGDGIALEAVEDSTALLLCGQPIGEPVIGQGPFVMNTREEIRQAMADFQSGAMGSLP
jgi:redox-sensitive bicupin YhaK (pirin superfamily)